MKKLIILAAAAAMSLGTLAAPKSYTLAYELQNIPNQVEGHLDHNFIYLADTNGNVYCYVDCWNEMTTQDGDNWMLAAAPIDHAAGSTAYPALAGKTVVAHTLTAATIVKSGTTNGLKFSVSFTSESDLDSVDHVQWIDEKAGTTLDLIAVVTDFEGDESCAEYKADSKPGATRTGADASGYTITASAAYPVLSLEAFSAEKIYDGLPTNATFTVSEPDATITVAYAGSEEGPWEDEEWDPVKFKDRVDTWARFTATKKGYKKAEAIAYVRITPRPVMVTAPNLTFPFDAEDDAIDAEIESQIDIEQAGLNPWRGVLEGDEITYKWAREDGSYAGSREADVSYEITFPDEGEYEDYNVINQYGENYEVCYVRGTLKFEEPEPVEVMLPATTGYGYVVSNLTEGAEAEIPAGVDGKYALPIGAKVGIYAVPEEGYVVTGEPLIIDEVKADTTIDPADLPKAEKSPELDALVVPRKSYVNTGYVPNHLRTMVEVSATAAAKLEGVALFCANARMADPSSKEWKSYYAHFDDDVTFENLNSDFCVDGLAAPATNTPFVIRYFRNTITLDGTTYTGEAEVAEDAAAGSQLCLFCSYQSTRTEWFEGSVNYVKIWEVTPDNTETNLVMDLVPALNSVGNATLYDKVGERYLTMSPASWTGLGEDANWTTANNWSGAAVPANEAVLFKNLDADPQTYPGTQYEVVLDEDVSISGVLFDNGANVKFTGGHALTVSNGERMDSYDRLFLGSAALTASGANTKLTFTPKESYIQSTGLNVTAEDSAEITINKWGPSDNDGYVFVATNRGNVTLSLKADSYAVGADYYFGVFGGGSQICLKSMNLKFAYENNKPVFVVDGGYADLRKAPVTKGLAKAYCDNDGWLQMAAFTPTVAGSVLSSKNKGGVEVNGNLSLSSGNAAATLEIAGEGAGVEVKSGTVTLGGKLTVKLTPHASWVESATALVRATGTNKAATLTATPDYVIDCTDLTEGMLNKRIPFLSCTGTMTASLPAAARISLVNVPDGFEDVAVKFAQDGKLVYFFFDRAAGQKEWTGDSVEGTLWSDGGNWDGGVAPGQDEVAHFTKDATVTLEGDTSKASPLADGIYVAAGVTVTFDGGSTNYINPTCTRGRRALMGDNATLAATGEGTFVQVRNDNGLTMGKGDAFVASDGAELRVAKFYLTGSDGATFYALGGDGEGKQSRLEFSTYDSLAKGQKATVVVTNGTFYSSSLANAGGILDVSLENCKDAHFAKFSSTVAGSVFRVGANSSLSFGPGGKEESNVFPSGTVFELSGTSPQVVAVNSSNLEFKDGVVFKLAPEADWPADAARVKIGSTFGGITALAGVKYEIDMTALAPLAEAKTFRLFSSNDETIEFETPSDVSLVGEGADGFEVTFEAVLGQSSKGKAITNAVDVTITPAIVPVYDITIVPPENGTLETSVTNGIAEGTVVTVTATPAENYELESITVDGVALDEGVFTFAMPAADVEVAATFKSVKQHGWSEDPTQDRDKTVAEVYPELQDSVFANVDACSLGAWANKLSIDFDMFAEDPEAFKDAFLLDCDPDDVDEEAEKFKFVSISQNADGSWAVLVTDDKPDGGDYKNGVVKVTRYSDVTCETPADEGNFFKASLELKTIAE